MLENFKIEGAEAVCCEVTQMYDYIHLTFFVGIPFDFDFTINLSNNDIDKIIELLKQAKKSLVQVSLKEKSAREFCIR